MGKQIDIEELFNSEIQGKKSQVHTNRAKAGKKGGSKSRRGMHTPYDFLSARERRKLHGEVVISNMYETILTREEFEAKDEETQKAMLQRWREIYPVKQIQKTLGVASATFYSYIEKYNLPKADRGTRRRAKLAEAQGQALTQVNLTYKQDSKEEVQQPQTVRLLTNGLHLEYNGEYDAEQLNKIFTKLQLITDGEPCKFKLSISLQERT